MLMFSVPGFLASVIICFALFGAATDVLWLFVLDDDPSPNPDCLRRPG